jgi:hypothetical protein
MANVINFETAKKRILHKKAQQNDPFGLSDAFGDDKAAVMQFALMVSFDIVEALADLNVFVENDPKTFRDILTILESIQGLIYRAKHENYAWHKVSDSISDIEDKDLPNLLEEYLENMVDSYE